MIGRPYLRTRCLEIKCPRCGALQGVQCSRWSPAKLQLSIAPQPHRQREREAPPGVPLAVPEVPPKDWRFLMPNGARLARVLNCGVCLLHNAGRHPRQNWPTFYVAPNQVNMMLKHLDVEHDVQGTVDQLPTP